MKKGQGIKKQVDFMKNQGELIEMKTVTEIKNSKNGLNKIGAEERVSNLKDGSKEIFLNAAQLDKKKG